jgi:hypothetical protein
MTLSPNSILHARLLSMYDQHRHSSQKTAGEEHGRMRCLCGTV